MKINFLFFAMIFSFPAISQVVEISHRKFDKKKFLIGVNFSSDFCNRHSFVNNNDDDLDEIVELFNEIQKTKAGYSTGIKILYNHSNKISLETGIQYSNQGHAIRMDNLFYGDQVDTPRYGFVYDTLPSSKGKIEKIRTRYNYHYIEIPLRILYAIGEKRLNYLVSVGFTTSYLMKYNEKFIMKYENGEVESKVSDGFFNDFNQINISPTLSIGASYRLSNKFCLKVEPGIRYGLIKVSDSPISGHLWSYGLNISCYYRLK